MPPLVLVPGLMCDGGLFSGILPMLSRDRAVVVADIGKDDCISAMADRLLGQVNGTFDLLGFSMGGFVALEVLHKAPERLRRVALLDTHASADTPEVVAWRKNIVQKAREGAMVQIMRDTLVPRYFDPSQPAPALAQACIETAAAIGADVFCRQFNALALRSDHHQTLRQFHGPALVLRGRYDALCNKRAHLKMVEALSNGRYVEVDGAAHLSVLERPAEVATQLQEFLLAV